jgi:asparagine synthase (glutamine-hydrolysing)
MCGIAGIFDIAGTSVIDKAVVVRMGDSISHRGPDGEGFFFAPGVGFAHRRLSIIDVAGGQQPIFNEDKTVSLIYNGEIYNYRELVKDLQNAGHIFRTHCDTEAVVHGWEQWGRDCVKRFRGMFAFAIFDHKQQKLFLARDRIGKKPLYYSIVGGRFLIFASELKALLAHPQFERRLDPHAVDDFMAFGYVPDPGAIYKGVFKLPPGNVLEVERGKPLPSPVEYWRPSFASRPTNEHEADLALIAKLDEAVRIRLMSDVPLGAFLSGGVDSSGIVASMALQSNGPVQTFALGFGQGRTDELAAAQRVATLYSTDHHEHTAHANPLEEYRRQAAIFDEPFADDSSVPTYHVCKLARSHVTVALSGDAGDELFAGYRRYRLHGAAENWRSAFPGYIRETVFGTAGSLYPKLDWAPRWMRAKYTLQELALDSAGGYFRTICKIQDDLRSQIYSAKMRGELEGHHPADLVATMMREADTSDPIAQAQYVDCRTYLPGDILTKVDRASMAVSLEVRVPMLDHEFMGWAGSLPRDLKLRGSEGKYILKRALEGRVPHENLYRPKTGFATPLRNFFMGRGTQIAKEAILSEEMADSGLFDLAALSRLIDQHDHGERDHSKPLWSLLMFGGFLKEVHHAERTFEKREDDILAAV